MITDKTIEAIKEEVAYQLKNSTVRGSRAHHITMTVIKKLLDSGEVTANQWQPINTCPEHEVVIFNVGNTLDSVDADLSMGIQKEMVYYGVSDHRELMDSPTHWMNLPQPPKEN